jgi:acetyl-CoA acetyltransferase
MTDRSELDLACEAICRAAADAGLQTRDLDGIVSFTPDRGATAMLQHLLRMERLRLSALAWHPGGGGICGAIQIASAAVQCGHADTVAVVRSLCQSADDRYGRHKSDRPFVIFNAPFGLFAPAPMMALVLRRHMHLYGTRAEQIGSIALHARANAQRNPRAVMHGRPLSMDDYLASRMIAEPLRLYDCCLESDGACALIVTTLERARDLAQSPARILAAAVGSETGWGAGAFGGHNMSTDIYATGNATPVARELFARAQVGPADVDVAQIYDAFTGMVLLALEDYGFCDRGSSGYWIESGKIGWPDGSLPVNTAGGNLSEAYVHGLNLVVEAVRQVRGHSTAQVADAEISFVCGATIESPSSALLLARG